MENPAHSNNGNWRNGVFSGTEDRSNPVNKYNQVNGNKAVNSRGNRSLQGYDCNRYTYDRCPNCPHNKRQDNTPLVLAVIFSVFTLAVIFLSILLFLIGMFLWKERSVQKSPDAASTSSYTEESYSQDNIPPSAGQNDSSKENKAAKKAENGYYGDLNNEVRTDLSYSIQWANYKSEENSDVISIEVDYPVIKGEVPNKDVLNTAIMGETRYFSEYYKEYSQYMLEGEIFQVYAKGFVTYMDEEVMSIVFLENIQTDYWTDCGLFCINIDMKNGVVIENSSILNVDSEFATDFRAKSREQNGTVDALDYMTDLEITQYMANAGTFIIFYTPLGMEVGLNYGEDYVTVTYKEYDKYLKRY